ncbi:MULTISPECIES: acyl-CoA thioesterase [Planobispora]|uniref:4-hydroxybenzoyl-CoA thioesterase n=1 Tax=Planobispora longispora TaxID=28887 RepID=A0A8J3RR71_9ACTN|nr:MULTISPECIES: thioesterase family protein [Planobispora]GIH78159.1 4-hydroxybenzoyl-CoA thioesterase [Planobispora longispora]
MGYVHPWHVRYYEVDQQGVVFNAWYLAWFDEAISGFFQHKGLPVLGLQEQGVDFQLVRAELNWRSGVRFGDDVSILVEPVRIGNTSFEVSFTVLRDAEAVCEARIVYVSIAGDGSGKCPVPEILRRVLG